MASSTASSMLLFLVLLFLVFPHMDKALGEQMQHRKLKETNHPDQLSVQKLPQLPPGWWKKFKRCPEILCKGPDILERIPPPPPRSSRSRQGPGH